MSLVIQFGGASAQIAFKPLQENIMEDLFPLRVGMKDQNLYSKSWLGFGTDVAFRGFEEYLKKKDPAMKNPCLPKGENVIIGVDAIGEEEYSEMKSKFDFDKCKKEMKIFLGVNSGKTCYYGRGVNQKTNRCNGRAEYQVRIMTIFLLFCVPLNLPLVIFLVLPSQARLAWISMCMVTAQNSSKNGLKIRFLQIKL